MSQLTYLRAKVFAAARELGASEEGATATEYVFLIVFIAIVMGVGALALGNAIDARFDSTATTVN